MAFTQNPQTKKWFSNLVLVSFLLLVGATAFLSSVFKTPLKDRNQFIEQALVFNNKELENITGLTLKNKSGEYIFSRADASPTSTWHMTSPRDLSAKSLFIEKLFTSLNVIKTKKMLADDKANNSNFSLDKPTAVLTLTDAEGKNIILSVGIMNTIDNSTYMKISERNGIYHVEAPSISLENITLANLVESSVFDINFNTITSFKIFKKGSKTPHFEITKKDGLWLNNEARALDAKRLEEMVDEFITLKSAFIIDELTEAQKKQTLGLTSSPEYTVKVEREDNPTPLIYQVSATTKSISDIDLHNEAHFIITEAHAPVVYVIKGDFLNRFEIKNDSLKALEKH
jgi:hypothetical protein